MLVDEENEQDIDVPQFNLEDLIERKEPKKTCLTCIQIGAPCSKGHGVTKALCNLLGCEWGKLGHKCLAVPMQVSKSRAIRFIEASVSGEEVTCPAWAAKKGNP